MDIEVASAPFVGGFASNHEFDATVTAGSDRVLLVAIGSGSTNDLYTAVLFNGVPMARAHRANNAGPSAYWYFLAAPAVGTFKVRIEQSAAGGCNAQAFLLKDAPQTGIIAATGPANAGNGFAISPWSSAISGAGRVALSVLHSATGPETFSSTTGTDVSGFGGNAAQFEVAYANNASAMAWSWAGAGQRNLVQSIIAIPGSIGPAGAVITGPTGAAGAASITTAAAENQNIAGVWTSTGPGPLTLGGTDAALLAISGGTVTLAAGNFNFEAKASYSFTVNDNAATQAVTLNITDINEPPSFIGPAIGALVFTVGTPITPVPLATRFVDPEGAAITASIVQALPAGLSVVSGQLQGTPTTPQAATSYTPRGADPAGNATNGTAFTIAILAAGTPPSISTQPQSQTVTAGANVTFSVTATGSGTLSYQWRRNGVNIAGANSASYTLATVLGDSGAVFSVVVTGDTAPPATSANATLTVNAAPTFSALTDVIAESGINLAAGTTVFWTWFPSGRPGAAATGINGTSQVNAQGRALISHTQAGAGMVLLGTRPGPTVADDRVYIDFLTLA